MSKVIYSLSGTPGSFGLRVYNHFFEVYHLDIVYQPIRVTTLAQLHKLLNDINTDSDVLGASISMPWKTLAYKYCINTDVLTPRYVMSSSAVNTVFIRNGSLYAGLTDVRIISSYLSSYLRPNGISTVYLYGQGAMASLSQHYLTRSGIDIIKLFKADKTQISEILTNPSAALINATPFDLSSLLDIDYIRAVTLDFPVFYDPKRYYNDYILDGLSATMLQFELQYQLYTQLTLPRQVLRSYIETMLH